MVRIAKQDVRRGTGGNLQSRPIVATLQRMIDRAQYITWPLKRSTSYLPSSFIHCWLVGTGSFFLPVSKPVLVGTISLLQSEKLLGVQMADLFFVLLSNW